MSPGRDRRRKRDRRGRLYDPRKKRDAGHQTHESRVQTKMRRTRWKSQGILGGLVSRLCFWRRR